MKLPREFLKIEKISFHEENFEKQNLILIFWETKTRPFKGFSILISVIDTFNKFGKPSIK